MNLKTLRPRADGLIQWRAWIVPTRATLPAYRSWWESGKVNPAKPKKPKLPPSQWPRLSEELTGPRHPEYCQACSQQGAIHDQDESIRKLIRWREHDEHDQPTRTLVILCQACSKKLIKKHPRLYDELQEYEPSPGAMPVCSGCWFQKELICRHPDLKRNGGAGLTLTMPKPFQIHYKAGRSGGLLTDWRGPVECSGRETLEKTIDETNNSHTRSEVPSLPGMASCLWD